MILVKHPNLMLDSVDQWNNFQVFRVSEILCLSFEKKNPSKIKNEDSINYQKYMCPATGNNDVSTCHF